MRLRAFGVPGTAKQVLTRPPAPLADDGEAGELEERDKEAEDEEDDDEELKDAESSSDGEEDPSAPSNVDPMGIEARSRSGRLFFPLGSTETIAEPKQKGSHAVTPLSRLPHHRAGRLQEA